MFLRIIQIFVMVFLLIIFLPKISHAQLQDSRYEAKVTKILEERSIKVSGKTQLYQKIELQITNGNLKDKKVIIESGKIPLSYLPKYKRSRYCIYSQNKCIGR